MHDGRWSRHGRSQAQNDDEKIDIETSIFLFPSEGSVNICLSSSRLCLAGEKKEEKKSTTTTTLPTKLEVKADAVVVGAACLLLARLIVSSFVRWIQKVRTERKVS